MTPHFLRVFALFYVGTFSVFWLATSMYWKHEASDDNSGNHGALSRAVAAILLSFACVLAVVCAIVAVVLIVRFTWTVEL